VAFSNQGAVCCQFQTGVSNQNTQLDATINHKILLLCRRHRSTCFGHQTARQTAIAASGFRMNVEVEVFSAVVSLLVSVISIQW